MVQTSSFRGYVIIMSKKWIQGEVILHMKTKISINLTCNFIFYFTLKKNKIKYSIWIFEGVGRFGPLPNLLVYDEVAVLALYSVTLLYTWIVPVLKQNQNATFNLKRISGGFFFGGPTLITKQIK